MLELHRKTTIEKLAEIATVPSWEERTTNASRRASLSARPSSRSLGSLLSSDPNVAKDPRRRAVAQLVWSEEAGFATMSLIFLNLCFIVFETDQRAKGYDPPWFAVVTWMFLGIYTVELTLRLYVERRGFFRSAMNCMEFGIVVSDILVQVVLSSWKVPSVSTLRVLRAVRLLRVIRAIRTLRELWLMLHGLIGALKSIGWAACLIVLFLLVFSILAVELLSDVNKELAMTGAFSQCERCESAFASIYKSSLTWFLLIFGGEGWLELAIPTMERYPMTSVIYLLAYVSINLGLLNLVLAVIVDRAHEARQEDAKQIITDKQTAYTRASRTLRRCFDEMDTDMDKQLSLEELRSGYDTNTTFREALDVMDVDRDDMDIIFKILDTDRSGAVNSEEFVKNLVKMKTEEIHTMLTFIKHNTADIKLHVDEGLQLLQRHVQKELLLLHEIIHNGTGAVTLAEQPIYESERNNDYKRSVTAPEALVSEKSSLSFDNFCLEFRHQSERLTNLKQIYSEASLPTSPRADSTLAKWRHPLRLKI